MAETAERASEAHQRRQRREIVAFLFLAVSIPDLAVATVGTYGLSVWIDQIINGPPGPPAER